MPDTDLTPQSQNQDVGFGVTFFAHPYRDPKENKIYYRHTHVPILGYCPGCSSKAHLNHPNLPLDVPSDATSPMSTSLTPTIIPQQSQDEKDSDDGMFPENGEIVTAETTHAGPSYSSPEYPVDESELRRCQMVQNVISSWVEAGAREEKQTVEHEAQKQRQEEQEEQMLIEAFAQKAEEARLDAAYEQGLVRIVDAPMHDDHDSDLEIIDENKLPSFHLNLSTGPPPSFNQTLSDTVDRGMQTMGDGHVVEFISEKKIHHAPNVDNTAEMEKKLKQGIQAKRRKTQLERRLVSKAQRSEKVYAKQGPGLGLEGYDSDSNVEEVETDPIILD